MNKDRDIMDALGKCRHFRSHYIGMQPVCAICGVVGYTRNPDFSTPAGTVQLLGIMIKRDDAAKFLARYLDDGDYGWIPYILKPGRFRDAVWEYLKEAQNER